MFHRVLHRELKRDLLPEMRNNDSEERIERGMIDLSSLPKEVTEDKERNNKVQLI